MFRRNGLLIAIFFGALAGGVCGWLIGEPMTSVKFAGDMFLQLLKMVVVPLIVLSLTCGVTSMGNVRKAGSFGAKVLLYFVLTTFVASLVGLVLVNVIEPGVGVQTSTEQEGVTLPDKSSFNLIPSNIVGALARGDMLPIIFFTIFFACVLSTVIDARHPTFAVLASLNDAVMKMTRLIVYLAPAGVFALVAARFGEAGGGKGVSELLAGLGLYAAAVVAGLAVHGVIILPALLYLLGKMNPVRYFAGVMEAMLMAFSTASSSATLPVTMKCLQENNNMPPKVSGFVLPVGATINMDGTALYEAVAALFIAQAYGIQLDISGQAVVFLTAALAAIGAAGIPEAGLVTMVMVLTSAGLPTEGIGMILSIDWLLDRFRTAVNVWGDCVAVGVLSRVAALNND